MKKILIFVLLIITFTTYSQQIYFDNRYDFNTGRYDGTNGVIILDSNNYVVAGVAIDSTSNFQKICIMDIDIHGVVQWKKSYHNPFLDYYTGVCCILNTKDSGFTFSGAVVDTFGNSKVILWKFNKFGDTLWTQSYGNGGFNSGQQCRQTNDGGFI